MRLSRRRNFGSLLACACSGGACVALAASPVHAQANDSLGLDWTTLDGVQMVYETPWSGGAMSTTAIRYALTRRDNATALLVATETHHRRLTPYFSESDPPAQRTQEVALDTDTLRLGLTSPTQLDEHFVRVTADKQAAGSNTLVLRDGAYAFRSTWTTRDTVARGPVPDGLIVPFVLYGAIAALPDSLPSVVTLWTLSLDTMKPEEARVEFEDPEEIRVPLIMPGNECSEDPMVRYATLPAVATTMYFGGRSFHFLALAHRPHVVVSDRQGLKCLRLSAGGQ